MFIRSRTLGRGVFTPVQNKCMVVTGANFSRHPPSRCCKGIMLWLTVSKNILGVCGVTSGVLVNVSGAETCFRHKAHCGTSTHRHKLAQNLGQMRVPKQPSTPLANCNCPKPQIIESLLNDCAWRQGAPFWDQG